MLIWNEIYAETKTIHGLRQRQAIELTHHSAIFYTMQNAVARHAQSLAVHNILIILKHYNFLHTLTLPRSHIRNDNVRPRDRPFADIKY